MEKSRTTPVMPMGKLRGHPLSEMTTPYLMWLLSQDAIRFKYRRLVREALGVLAARFLDFEKLAEELTPSEQPKEYWKLKETTAVIRQKKKEQKPIDAGERWRQERARALRAEIARRQTQPAADPNDISDLL